MEFLVEHVNAKDCHVWLPYSLVQLLSETNFPPVPLFLDLQLSSQKRNGTVDSESHKDVVKETRWCLAWMGEMAKSEHLEVPVAFGRCIGLNDRTGVRVRIRKPEEIVAATMVELEPSGPDDWEMLELNREYLEKNIQSQVSVLCEGQQVTIWIRHQAFISLRTLKCSPQPLVRLVNGSELIVAPKERSTKKISSGSPATSSMSGDSGLNLPSNSSDLRKGKIANGLSAPTGRSIEEGGGRGKPVTNEAVRPKGRVIARLRVQEVHPSLAVLMSLNGKLEAVAMPSCQIYLSPITANQLCLSDCQLVFISAPSSISSGSISQTSSESSLFESDSKNDKNDNTLAIGPSSNGTLVQIRLSEGVAQGHAMVGPTLRLQVGLNLLGQVKLHVSDAVLMDPPHSVLLSPLHFKGARDILRNGSEKKTTEELNPRKSLNKMAVLSWHSHRDLLNAARNSTAVRKESVKIGTGSEELGGAGALFSKWLSSQARESDGMEKEAPLTDGMVIHFKVRHKEGSTVEENVFENEVETTKEFKGHVPGNKSEGQEKEHWDIDERNGKSKGKGIAEASSRVNDEKEIDTCFMVSFEAGSSRRVEGKDDEDTTRRGKQERNEGVFCKVAALKEALAVGSVKVKLGKAVLGHVVNSVAKSEIDVNDLPIMSSRSWLQPTAEHLRIRLKAILSEPARKMRLKMGTPRPGGVLFTGAQAGEMKKAALAVAREMREDSNCQVYVVVMKCAELVGESLKDVRKTVESQVGEAVDHAPSIIVLDDLDVLLPSANEAEAGAGAAAIVVYLSDIFDYCQSDSCPPVAFLGLARSPATLAQALQVSGRLDFHVELPAPGETDRLAILTEALEERNMHCSESLLTSVASRCQGFDMSDMEVLVNRAVHAGSARLLVQLSEVGRQREDCKAGNGRNNSFIRKRERLELLEGDFRKAEEGFVPAAMRSVVNSGATGQGVSKGWQDVGGLWDVRKALKEILEMPAKHSRLFADAPLRLRSGVLLYGPPGCGKTHVVGAAAAACGLRCVAVKGPELLNKYIGASEQAVRDVFSKASMAAPCILFFDEFDAIAPKRGHDNTGVTDRVVNQLLTELDGVEGLTGVFVIAATSRPDLIDAALLRPGRLDRLLLCDFPREEDRVEILRALARHLPMAPDVDLEEVGKLTNGFSGADLQALLAEAQLAAVHAVLDGENEVELHGTVHGTVSDDLKTPLITPAVIRQAVGAARPSVPDSERMRLDAIYDSFLSSKSAGPSKESKGKRATLA